MITNSLLIIGNLTRDPKECKSKTGNTFAAFDVAVNRGRGEARETTYFSVTAFDKLADTALKFARKGRKVAIRGEVSARAYAGKDGEPRASLEVRARELEFMDAPAREDQPAEQPADYTPVSTPDDMPW